MCGTEGYFQNFYNKPTQPDILIINGFEFSVIIVKFIGLQYISPLQLVKTFHMQQIKSLNS